MWNSVKQSLPVVRQWVIADGPNFPRHEAFLDETGWWRFSTGWGQSLSAQFCYVENITHWMPLPERPEA